MLNRWIITKLYFRFRTKFSFICKLKKRYFFSSFYNILLIQFRNSFIVEVLSQKFSRSSPQIIRENNSSDDSPDLQIQFSNFIFQLLYIRYARMCNVKCCWMLVWDWKCICLLAIPNSYSANKFFFIFFTFWNVCQFLKAFLGLCEWEPGPTH